MKWWVALSFFGPSMRPKFSLAVFFLGPTIRLNFFSLAVWKFLVYWTKDVKTVSKKEKEKKERLHLMEDLYSSIGLDPNKFIIWLSFKRPFLDGEK